MAAQNLRKFVNGVRLSPNHGRYIRSDTLSPNNAIADSLFKRHKYASPSFPQYLDVLIFLVMVVGVVFFPNSLACLAALCDLKAAVHWISNKREAPNLRM